MAAEVGKAYVTLIPSAKGFASAMQRELSGEMARAGKSLGEDLGENISDSAGKETESGLKSVLGGAKSKALGLLGGLAIGATLTKGLTDAMDADAGRAKLTAQLGLTAKQSGRVGKVAGTLFGQNYGDSMEQVNEAIGSVVQNIDGMRGASEESLGRISTKVLNTANIFGQDLGGVTRAVSQMMRTGLAKNADEALDIVTKGFQSGADKSEDFLDTLNEYGTQFRKVGIDGKTATGLISQGLQAGARDGDIVADSIKEFSIRAIDGSETTSKGFRAIGLDAEKMAAQIGKGGPAAKRGLSTVLDHLRGIKDPAKQAAAATALFGTQSEDLGKALFALHPETAAKGLGKVAGAADRANKKLNDTPSARIDALKRALQQGLTNAMTKYVLPAVEKIVGKLEDWQPKLEKIGNKVKDVTGFLKEHKTAVLAIVGLLAGLTVLTYAHAAAMAVSSGAARAWVTQTKVVQAATKAWAAVQWVLNSALLANPVTWIVIAIIALVVVVILVVKKLGGWHAVMDKLGKAFDKFKALMSKVWHAVKDAVVKGVTKVVEFVKGLPGKALNALKSLGSKLKSLFGRAWDAVKNAVGKGVDKVVAYVKDTPRRFMQNLRNVGSLLKGLFTRAWDLARDTVTRGAAKVIDFIRGLPGKIRALGGKFLDVGKAIIGKFVDGLQNAAGVIGGIAGNIWDALQGLLNGAIDKINGALSFTLHIPGPDISINPPDIPHLATGGRATGGTLAVIGEGSEAETVLPDSLLRGLLENVHASGASSRGGGVHELVITNWHDGTGYFRAVADRSVADDTRFRRHVGGMRG